MKSIKMWYWVATGIFAAWLVFDGLGGVLEVAAGRESLAHLGYPIYMLVVTGLAKIAAGLAILQPKYRTIKEWAFAGYAINCYGAFASHIAVGDSVSMIILPIMFLAIMGVPYYLWKKVEPAHIH